MSETQRNICCTCKFWNPWRVVILADDEAKALGHCVIEMPTGINTALVQIQGLTAEDFYCGQFQPAATQLAEKTGGSDE